MIALADPTTSIKRAYSSTLIFETSFLAKGVDNCRAFFMDFPAPPFRGPTL
jgi:hypothetical protein